MIAAFHGSANRLDVMGNENTLIIDAQLDKIDVVGNDNQIKIVRRKGRREPEVNSVGKDNKVSYKDAQ